MVLISGHFVLLHTHYVDKNQTDKYSKLSSRISTDLLIGEHFFFFMYINALRFNAKFIFDDLIKCNKDKFVFKNDEGGISSHVQYC